MSVSRNISWKAREINKEIRPESFSWNPSEPRPDQTRLSIFAEKEKRMLGWQSAWLHLAPLRTLAPSPWIPWAALLLWPLEPGRSYRARGAHCHPQNGGRAGDWSPSSWPTSSLSPTVSFYEPPSLWLSTKANPIFVVFFSGRCYRRQHFR
jgi:hypothetical protein